MAPIHDAIRAFDVDALRRELDRGVCPDLEDDDSDIEDEDICTPLYLAVVWGSGKPEKNLEERVACVADLLEAGATVNLTGLNDQTALHLAVPYDEYGDIVDLLIAAGADVNAVDDGLESPLEYAAELGCAAMVKKLISAGAIYLDDALRLAVSRGRLRNCALLIRAGAALPDEEKTRGFLEVYASNWDDPCRVLITRARTYIERISATIGGFQAYEREHCRRLTTVFANKFPALPIEVISHIVLLWAHCGDYDYQDYALPRAEHWRMVSEQIERERKAAAADSEEE